MMKMPSVFKENERVFAIVWGGGLEKIQNRRNDMMMRRCFRPGNLMYAAIVVDVFVALFLILLFFLLLLLFLDLSALDEMLTKVIRSILNLGLLSLLSLLLLCLLFCYSLCLL